MEAAIAGRKKFPVNRQTLVSSLKEQYETLRKIDSVEENIESLLDDRTFTVCTAHQPNLLTGYLYFVYKILHAIRLAEELKVQFPAYNFVPVYYMGSEDNDLDELGTFRYNDKKFVWDAAGQTGAVGRMSTESLKPLLQELFRQLGPPGEYCEELKTLITDAYLGHKTVGAATQYLVHELFGRYGLLVLDPDNRQLKSSFIDVMKDDLLHHTANDIVTKQAARLSEFYKAQAYPRPINLFYLKDNIRERIEQVKDKWVVLNTDVRWTEAELMTELEEYPERFSPNVILRGLFQETILPDVAFIGGGAEVAYWLQLKDLFEHYGVYYPSIHLRQSAAWIGQHEHKLRGQLAFSIADIFMTETDLVHRFIKANSADDWQAGPEMVMIEQAMTQLRQKATVLDPTLKPSAEAALAKMRYQLQVLEKKMLRAEKRKMQDQLLRISKLKAHVFPNGGLQERVENFITYYLRYGNRYFDLLKDNIDPFRHEFLIVEEE